MPHDAISVLHKKKCVFLFQLYFFLLFACLLAWGDDSSTSTSLVPVPAVIDGCRRRITDNRESKETVYTGRQGNNSIKKSTNDMLLPLPRFIPTPSPAAYVVFICRAIE